MAEKRQYSGDMDVTNGNKRPRPSDSSNGDTPKSSKLQDQLAAARAKAAAFRERFLENKANNEGNGQRTESSSPAPVASTNLSPAEAARARVQALKARVAAATGRGISSELPQRTISPASELTQTSTSDGSTKARGGLGIGLHPALMGDSGLDSHTKSKAPMGSRFSTTIGNRRGTESPVQRPSSELKGRKHLDLSVPTMEELKQNPYFDASLSGSTAVPRARKGRELIFHQKGKFITQAAALRRQAQLEEMKKRIAESARKAGLEEDRTEKAFLVEQPPGKEWWDEGLVTGDAYPDFEDDAIEAEKQLKIDTEDSIITRYIQHPVLLQPPQEKVFVPVRTMYLTKKEQQKKRRQERMELLKEKQAKERLGLVAPEPPKIKIKNMVQVLGEQAVKDPTAVEARVRGEIEAREQKHKEMNESRKLTKEQRHEKLTANQEKDAMRGILMNVYRIDSLAYGKHRYQIDINAKQHQLTGITILNPKVNVVIVEGGQHSIAKYKKLMLQRIRWTDIAPPTLASQEHQPRNNKDKGIAEAEWLQPEDESGQLKDMSENRCILVWEGEPKERAFKYWGSRVCETDSQARQALEKYKMEGMWSLARNWTSD